MIILYLSLAFLGGILVTVLAAMTAVKVAMNNPTLIAKHVMPMIMGQGRRQRKASKVPPHGV